MTLRLFYVFMVMLVWCSLGLYSTILGVYTLEVIVLSNNWRELKADWLFLGLCYLLLLPSLLFLGELFPCCCLCDFCGVPWVEYYVFEWWSFFTDSLLLVLFSIFYISVLICLMSDKDIWILLFMLTNKIYTNFVIKLTCGLKPTNSGQKFAGKKSRSRG